MKAHYRIGTTIAGLALLALATARPSAAQIAPTSLPSPGAFEHSQAFAINAAGQVAGRCWTTTYTNAEWPVVWQNGAVTQLPLPAYGGGGIARDINAAGQVVGGAGMTTTQDYQACLWQNSRKGWTATLLGLPAGCTGSMAVAVSNAGQVLGVGWTAGVDGSDVGFIWNNGVTTALKDGDMPLIPMQTTPINTAGQVLCVRQDGTLMVWSAGTATPVVSNVCTAFMNNLGQIAGTCRVEGIADDVSFYFLPADAYGIAAGLHTTTPVGYGQYLGIDDDGQILVGKGTGVAVPTTDLEFQQLGGATTSLGNVPGFIGSCIMNATGGVSGTCGTDTTPGAFYTSAATGVIMLAGGTPGLLYGPADINDSGLIAGSIGTLQRTTEFRQAVLWTAPPPPIPAGLIVDSATATRKSGTVTVTVKLSVPDPNGSAASSTFINAATLGGISTATAVPVRVGTVRAGTSKSVSVTFRNVTAGSASFTVEGTSSFGTFSKTLNIVVP